jgi:hypothetical protein
MKTTHILYDQETGMIYYSVKDADWLDFTHSTNIPLADFEINEEDPDRKTLRLDVTATLGKRDAAGSAKYTIEPEPVTGVLCVAELNGWEETHENLS